MDSYHRQFGWFLGIWSISSSSIKCTLWKAFLETIHIEGCWCCFVRLPKQLRDGTCWALSWWNLIHAFLTCSMLCFSLSNHHFCRADTLSCGFDSLLHPSKMPGFSLPIQKGIDFPWSSQTFCQIFALADLLNFTSVFSSFVCSAPLSMLVSCKYRPLADLQSGQNSPLLGR